MRFYTFQLWLLFFTITLEVSAQLTLRIPPYNDFTFSKDRIWAVNRKGMDVFNKNGERVSVIANSSGIKFITQDKVGNVVVVDETNEVKRYNETNNSWEPIGKIKGEYIAIVFDKGHRCYTIRENGIEDLQTGKIYFTNNSLNHQIRRKGKWDELSCYLIDKDDQIWLGFDYGEWGGDIVVFDTQRQVFTSVDVAKFQVTLCPIKSFFQDSTAVYVSAGLAHGVTSGAIARIDNLCATVIFTSATQWNKVTGSEPGAVEGECIGPAAFNPFDGSIYFYSQHGVFKGAPDRDLSRIANWEQVVVPEFRWNGHSRDAVAIVREITKLVTIDNNRFVLVAGNEGVLYYDGKYLHTLDAPE